MQMKIDNIKFGEFELTNKTSFIKKIREIIVTKLNTVGVMSYITFVQDDMSLVFDIVPMKSPKKLFLSKIQNKVLLPEDDSRRGVLNRDYLKTYRLTNSQWDFVWKDCINDTLDKLGVSCNITMKEKVEDTEMVSLRSGAAWSEWKYKDKANIIQENK